MAKKKSPRVKAPRGKGYEVVCPQCGESCHETTRHFNSNKEADGIMLQNKREFTAAHDQAWDEPMQGGGSGPLVCLRCDGALAPSGHLLVRKLGAPPPSEPPEEPKEQEPELPTDEGPKVKSDTINICPKCRPVHQPLIAGEGDKVVRCPIHGEMTLEELGIVPMAKEEEPPNLALGEVVQKGDKAAFLCGEPECKRTFKTRQARDAHSRVHKK